MLVGLSTVYPSTKFKPLRSLGDISTEIQVSYCITSPISAFLAPKAPSDCQYRTACKVISNYPFRKNCLRFQYFR